MEEVFPHCFSPCRLFRTHFGRRTDWNFHRSRRRWTRSRHSSRRHRSRPAWRPCRKPYPVPCPPSKVFDCSSLGFGGVSHRSGYIQDSNRLLTRLGLHSTQQQDNGSSDSQILHFPSKLQWNFECRDPATSSLYRGVHIDVQMYGTVTILSSTGHWSMTSCMDGGTFFQVPGRW